MSKKQLTIWFDDKGNMLTQASYINPSNASQYNYKSEEAKDFDDSMEYVEIREYTRKSTRIHLKSGTSGRKYSMFIEDFDLIVKANKFVNNRIEGTFQFIKRGSGQAIKLVLPKTP